ncbi:hypothetical protein LTR37_020527 [Vermiconidia calcicola]|uniref:Uncharacterized protein n=1 Tax=Vermiconidia calcicola TaxID=1690605 RepID=A0ACC3MB36_9PEZI|nr:hypothetical protein LTR37_020527 [Vermiconidia calcicola]
MADVMRERLEKFDPSKNEKYDPGQIVIFFDSRTMTTRDDKFSMFQSYWTTGLYRLGWPSLYTPNLDPGNLRLVWYTHTGNEGHRDFPLHRAYAVKDMFDSLSDQGFRPMVMGWSGENPFPMIGGAEPPSEPQKPKMKVATSWSGNVSGHGKDSGTPHDRVMAIIGDEERKQAEGRRKEVVESEKGGNSISSPV